MFLQQLFNGLTLGATYSLIALGYSMIFGVLSFINFAHGDVAMFGSYLTWFLLVKKGVGLVPALTGGLITSMLIGVTMIAETAPRAEPMAKVREMALFIFTPMRPAVSLSRATARRAMPAFVLLMKI